MHYNPKFLYVFYTSDISKESKTKINSNIYDDYNIEMPSMSDTMPNDMFNSENDTLTVKNGFDNK
jgi:hypothetical protein